MVLKAKQLNNFWSKVNKTDSCWNWTGRKLNGYGKVNINCKVYNAHRISLIIEGILTKPSKKELGARGEIIMHTCDNRSCVNPKHLKVATQKENVRDSLIKGRKYIPDWSSENNPKAKLSTWKVKEIRESDESASVLSKRYGVHSTQIYNIINLKSWVLAK